MCYKVCNFFGAHFVCSNCVLKIVRFLYYTSVWQCVVLTAAHLCGAMHISVHIYVPLLQHTNV